MESYIVPIEVFLHVETEKALKISSTDARNGAVWVPKSQIEIESIGGDLYEVSMPFWLAHDKGLI